MNCFKCFQLMNSVLCGDIASRRMSERRISQERLWYITGYFSVCAFVDNYF